MEHFRRHGFSKEIRQLGLPPDYPTDIAYFTRFSTHELARVRQLTSAQAIEQIHLLGGSWSAAELPHRVSQKYVEPILKRHAAQWKTNNLRFGVEMKRFEREEQGVTAWVQPVDGSGPETQIHCHYLVGADGPRSQVRHGLGIDYEGIGAVKRKFMGGKMFAVYFNSPDLYKKIPHDRAWMYVAVNAERQALLASVNGVSEFSFHASVFDEDNADAWTEEDAHQLITTVMGCEVKTEILSHLTWFAGRALYANKLSDGPVFIMGDAAHLFTPTGGLGYNTAVEDAVNLGWKLASVIKGQSPPALLDSYSIERKMVAKRNTTYSTFFADSLGNYELTPHFELNTPEGVAERKKASEYFDQHGRFEFDIPGVTFGGRYDGSPVIVSDNTLPPKDEPNHYVPTACPGGRPPHLWLDEQTSLYDTFNFEWTLVCTGTKAAEHQEFIVAAQQRGMDLKVVHHPHSALHSLYEAPLALIRPDNMVAWRGQNDHDAKDVIEKVLGWTS
jgi:2-polyprenyl-6-methoxyphenol hydroxylase-like FAD-dependent oxidoreductase